MSASATEIDKDTVKAKYRHERDEWLRPGGNAQYQPEAWCRPAVQAALLPRAWR